MAQNGISTLPTKEQRQIAKLDLAAQKKLQNGYTRHTYVITQLPTKYTNNDVTDNPNAGGLTPGRPWV